MISDDRDSGELVFRLRRPLAGVLSFRLDTTRLSVLLARLDDVLAHHHERLRQYHHERFHHILVVTRNELRQRAA